VTNLSKKSWNNSVIYEMDTKLKSLEENRKRWERAQGLRDGV